MYYGWIIMSSTLAGTSSVPPNILMITCHDLGRHVGSYGRPVGTPQIDRLASEGVQFERYFVCAPQCSPSRASMTTGRYPHRTGVMGLLNLGPWKIDQDCPTLAKSLSAGGYDTWLWGFQHEHPDPSTLGYRHDPIGFRDGQVPKILADYVTPRLCDWLVGKPSEPWFASVGLYETHLGWPKERRRSEAFAASVPPYLPDGPELRQDMQALSASLDRVDRSVGRILDTLEVAGLASNTLVVFTTDHGLPLPRAKCTLYDPGLEAALLIRWPAVLAGNRRCSELLSGVDLMPTLLDAAGVASPNGMDGRSFGALLTGGVWQPRPHIFAEQTWHDAYCPIRAVRTDRYKLIRRFEPRLPDNILPKDFYSCCAASEVMRKHFDRTPPLWEAYDLASDPYEMQNLFQDKPHDHPIFGRLATTLDRWMQDTDDPIRLGPVALS